MVSKSSLRAATHLYLTLTGLYDVLAATAARLLRDHGTELHGAGWGVLDLFGLHPTAPMPHPPG